MNNTFNAKRFGLVFKKTLFERQMQMFGFTALTLALVFITYTAFRTISGFELAQNITFILGFSLSSCFMASFVFAYFSSNASGSSYLTLPASSFEKWLCGVLIAGVLFPLIFLLFFRIVDASFVWFYHNNLDSTSPEYKIQYNSVFILPLDGAVARKVYPLFLALSGSMMLGSLYFNKVSFIKTAITLCIICFGGFALNWIFAIIFFGNVTDAAPFNHVTIPVGKEQGSIEHSKFWANIFFYGIAYVVPILVWGISYVRLRDKEF